MKGTLCWYQCVLFTKKIYVQKIVYILKTINENFAIKQHNNCKVKKNPFAYCFFILQSLGEHSDRKETFHELHSFPQFHRVIL